MLKSPNSSQEKKPIRSLRKLMKRKLSFKTKDRTNFEEFGDTYKWKFGKKNKLPNGIPREIVFSPDSDDYDDDFSTGSQSLEIPDLVSAETPIKTGISPPSERSSYQQQTNALMKSLSDRLQALPDRFQPLQNALFVNRKSLVAVAAAALVCTQVPETTKLQLSVFAAGLSSTIMEQSKALITQKRPKTRGILKKPELDGNSEEELLPVEMSILPAEFSRVLSDESNSIKLEQGNVSEDHESRATDDVDDNMSDQRNGKAPHQMQQVVPAESNQGIISSPDATLQEDDSGDAMDHFHRGEHGRSSPMVTSQRGEDMPERDENFIVVQSNILVQQHGSGNTVIVQNNIVVPEGSKGTIIVQSNIEAPEGTSQTVNIDQLNESSTYQIGRALIGQLGTAMQWGTNKQLFWESEPTEIADGAVNPSDRLEDEEPFQIVPKIPQPAADEELPAPECSNVFEKFLNKDCRGEVKPNAPKEQSWIESLLTDAWILNKDL